MVVDTYISYVWLFSASNQLQNVIHTKIFNLKATLYVLGIIQLCYVRVTRETVKLSFEIEKIVKTWSLRSENMGEIQKVGN